MSNKSIITFVFMFLICIATFNSLFCEVTKLKFYLTSKINAYGPIFGEEDTNSARITSLMFESPLKSDANWTIKPNLFTKANIIGDLLPNGQEQYTFDIRNDLKWSDSEERCVTAKDVEFTFKVIKNAKVQSSNVKSKVEKIANIEVVGKYQVRVTFNQSDESNLGALTFNILPEYRFADLDRQDPYYLKATDSFFQEEPTGCGMYKYHTIVRGIVTILERNDSYSLSEKPRFEEITIEKKENISNIVGSLISKKDVNLMLDVPIGRREEIIQKPNLNVISYKEFSWNFIAFNLRKPIFKDENIRRAINLAVNTADMNDKIFRGDAELLTGPFPPLSPAYNSAFRPEFFNPNEAKKLLAQSGWIDNDNDGFVEKNGKKLELHLTYIKKTNADDNIFTSIRNFLKDIGIDLSSNIVNPDDLNTEVFKNHDFDMALVSFKFGTDPEIYTIFHSSADKPMGNNICGFSFPEIDNLLEEARKTPNIDVKMNYYRMLHNKIYKKYPGIFLWQRPKFIAFDREITGIKQENLDPTNIFKYINKW